MFEVEAKIHISKEDYKRLDQELAESSVLIKNVSKKDVYYQYPGTEFIRIREAVGETEFMLKIRKVKKGIEQNMELGWELEDIAKWKQLLKGLGLTPTIKKTKQTRVYKKDIFNIELSEVKPLGYFLEIEAIAKKRSEIDGIQLKLVNLFQALGFKPKQFEKKPYLQLLKEANV